MSNLSTPRQSRFYPLILGIFTAGFASNVAAEAPKLSAGLWEMSVLTDGQSILDKLGGKIPPAAIKQMRAAGVQLTDTGNIQFCVSQASAEQGWQPQVISQDCKYDVKWNGPNGRYITTCQGKTVSSGDIAIASAKSWSSTSRSKPENGSGPTVVQATKAKWAGEDCLGLLPK
jgi:hypothetical protein